MKKIGILFVTVAVFALLVTQTAIADSSSVASTNVTTGSQAQALSGFSYIGDVTAALNLHSEGTVIPRNFPDPPNVPITGIPQYIGNGHLSWNATEEAAVWNEKEDWYDGDYYDNKDIAAGICEITWVNKRGYKQTTKAKRINLADKEAAKGLVTVAVGVCYMPKKSEEVSFNSLWIQAVGENVKKVKAPNLAIKKIGASNGYGSWARNFGFAGAGSFIESGVGNIVSAITAMFSKQNGGAAASNYTYIVVKYMAPPSDFQVSKEEKVRVASSEFNWAY